jgi:hypothetical protein
MAAMQLTQKLTLYFALWSKREARARRGGKMHLFFLFGSGAFELTHFIFISLTSDISFSFAQACEYYSGSQSAAPVAGS